MNVGDLVEARESEFDGSNYSPKDYPKSGKYYVISTKDERRALIGWEGLKGKWKGDTPWANFRFRKIPLTSSP